jgi:branched-chain amino acid transport system substrate-binding protein
MNKKIVLGFAAVLILALVGVGIFRQANQNKSKKEVIKIGAILPLTGEISSFATPLLEGIEVAKEKINKDNRINLQIVIEDSKADAKTAITALEKLKSFDKVRIVIGDISSSTTLALIPEIEKNEMFLLCPGASSPKLTNISKNYARSYPSSAYESKVAAERFLNKGFKNVGIVFVNSEYGIGLHDAFASTFRLNGGHVIFEEKFPERNLDFRNIISRLKTTKPECLYLAGNQKEMGVFVKQLAESNFSLPIIANMSFLEKECLDIAGTSAKGVEVPIVKFDPKDTLNTGTIDFTNLFIKKYGRTPSLVNAIGFDAVMLVYTGLLENGNNPTLVANYVRNLKNYQGAVGRLNFINGEVELAVEFKVVD